VKLTHYPASKQLHNEVGPRAGSELQNTKEAADLSRTLGRRWSRIIPIAFVMYTISYVDRTNISLCVPAMSRDLGMNAVEAGNILGIFFWGYLWLQIPGGHLARIWSAKHVVSILLVAWGLCAIGTGLVSTWHGVWIMRLLLGVAEGGVFPATLVLLSNWFVREERARANGYWMLCQPFAVVISSPLSGYILGRWGWRTVLISEGCLPFLWLILWNLRIDNSPQEANWISDAERIQIINALQVQPAARSAARQTAMIRAVLSRETGIMTAVYFLLNCGGYGFLFWLPSALSRAKELSPFSISVLFALPYVLAGIVMVINCRHSDRSGDRRFHVMTPLLLGGLFLIAAIVARERSFLAYFSSICLAGAGTYAAIGPFWAMPAELLPIEAAAPATGLINAIGNLGGFLGPVVVGLLAKLTGNFSEGFLVLSVSLIAAGILSLTLKPAILPA
jgi:sugar phosphate permease